MELCELSLFSSLFSLPSILICACMYVREGTPECSEAIMNLLSSFSLLPLGGQLEGEPVVLSRLGILNFGHVVAGMDRGHRFVITNRNPVLWASLILYLLFIKM